MPEEKKPEGPSIDDVLKERDQYKTELETFKNRSFKLERMITEMKDKQESEVHNQIQKNNEQGEQTLRQRLKALEEERAIVRQGAVSTALRSAVQSAGVTDPVFQKHAVKILSENKYKVSPDMTSVVYDDGLDGRPITDFVKDWLQSDDGTPFRPQKNYPRNGPVGGGRTTIERLKKPIEQYSATEIANFNEDEINEFHQKMGQ